MRPLRFAALAAALAWAVPARAKEAALVGKWDSNGAPFAELKADGTGWVDHDTVKWKAEGKKLTLMYATGDKETMAYALSGNSLVVDMDGEKRTLTRSGAKGGTEKGGRGAAKAAAGGAVGKGKSKGSASARGASAGGGRLAQLLTSSAWCYFSYNQISGSSHQERVVFRANGTWDSGARGESYSSGAYGSVAGQSDSGSGGRWEARGQSLFMSEGAGPLQDIGLTGYANSSGYPILKTGNKEYSQCR